MKRKAIILLITMILLVPHFVFADVASPDADVSVSFYNGSGKVIDHIADVNKIIAFADIENNLSIPQKFDIYFVLTDDGTVNKLIKRTLELDGNEKVADYMIIMDGIEPTSKSSVKFMVWTNGMDSVTQKKELLFWNELITAGNGDNLFIDINLVSSRLNSATAVKENFTVTDQNSDETAIERVMYYPNKRLIRLQLSANAKPGAYTVYSENVEDINDNVIYVEDEIFSISDIEQNLYTSGVVGIELLKDGNVTDVADTTGDYSARVRLIKQDRDNKDILRLYKSTNGVFTEIDEIDISGYSEDIVEITVPCVLNAGDKVVAFVSDGSDDSLAENLVFDMDLSNVDKTDTFSAGLKGKNGIGDDFAIFLKGTTSELIETKKFKNIYGEDIDYISFTKGTNPYGIRITDESLAGRSMTAQFWIRAEDNSSANIVHMIGGTGTAESDFYSNTLQVAWNGTSGAYWKNGSQPDYFSLDATEWKHITIVRDVNETSNTVKYSFYVNGELSHSKGEFQPVSFNGEERAGLQFGAKFGTAFGEVYSPDKLELASVKIYDGVRPASRIKFDYMTEADTYSAIE